MSPLEVNSCLDVLRENAAVGWMCRGYFHRKAEALQGTFSLYTVRKIDEILLAAFEDRHSQRSVSLARAGQVASHLGREPSKHVDGTDKLYKFVHENLEKSIYIVICRRRLFSVANGECRSCLDRRGRRVRAFQAPDFFAKKKSPRF
ncbi:hypothetical protein TGPRC2_425900 [Toxoplasma gondii TgCatPRC2]|uniref:Uncharacterized protein n=1 Tax=Toxoplasma gondii TgCatPRC2 TaxID=1130821 RepID=A0A151H806_TOXGO|nr:hypothetical protein TGPRC2_425900 [Toxoplasma gondii TgCatPRC2]